MSTISYDEAAALLAQAEATLTPISPIRHHFGARDLEAAYSIQEINIARRVAGGEVRVGRKIGLTAPAVQAQFNVDEPDYGVLLDTMALADGSTLDFSTMIHPKIEAEVAFVLGADILDTDLETIRAAVAYVSPSLEIVDCRIENYDISIVDTISDNAAVAYYVLGADRHSLDDVDLASIAMTLTCDGTEISAGTGADCLGDPLNAVQWLAKTAIDRGQPLRAGEVIISGSLGPIAPLTPGATHTAVFSGFGSVSITTTDATAAGAER